ncbi:gpi16 subunit, GPI transamidase component domain-containing protein [Ditylenchus destructor]|uniref:Gpi16 subunit, GPI transamidase component domain-containing protein n=1 Tax=Ditylenchus destructor TaxID=166010 RepID=A0AAD4N1R9_9BILA|nr:gpi16 subunit, GPI transamidase component domain-containing protein [Ditylenchus destructor]
MAVREAPLMHAPAVHAPSEVSPRSGDTSLAQSDSNGESSLLYVPWLFRQIFAEHNIAKFHLSLTQGFWRTNLWGVHYPIDVPTGTQLLVKFLDSANNSIDPRWNALIHQLNGIFCTSILSMEPSMTTSPTLYPEKSSKDEKMWRYGQLSAESVCSENLKAWKKFLPCKERGLVSLLEPRNLLSSNFHSIMIRAERETKHQTGQLTWSMELYAQTVHSPREGRRLDPTPNSLFGRQPMTSCPVAETGRILVNEKPATSENEERVLNVHTFTKSTSQARGKLTSRIRNPYPQDLPTTYVHMVPWKIRLYMHTLAFLCKTKGSKEWTSTTFKERRLSLARDGKRPVLMELEVNLPAESVCQIEVDYETAFLKMTDYPADASSGIYVPGPILTLEMPKELNSQLYVKSSKDWNKVRIHGEPLLILLPVPDFSMPFNVICLVCTSIAIYYGNAVTTSTKLMKAVMKDASGADQKKPLVKLIEKAKGLFAKMRSIFRRSAKENAAGAEITKQ